MRSVLVLLVCFSSSFSWAQSLCESQAILGARLFAASENQINLRYIVAESAVVQAESNQAISYNVTMVDDSIVQVRLLKSDCHVVTSNMVTDE